MMKNRHRNRDSGQQRVAGFTLMEVLVTIVILSIGLLGVAGLQLNSLRGNQNGLEASVAAALATEAVDRVRANLPAVRNMDTGKLRGDAEYTLVTSAGSNPGCTGSTCTVAQVAQKDAYEWITAIQTQLPGGVGVICQDDTPDDGYGGSTAKPWTHECDGEAATKEIFAVKIAWDHDRDPDTPFTVFRMSFIP
jgi:type IV pilus assembly protein PilV